MGFGTAKPVPADRESININDRDDLKYWCEKFKVSPLILREAVEQVGVGVKDVEAYLLN